jgi:hypothetical protein
MLLELNGVTIELVHAQDINRYKGFGYKEVKPVDVKEAEQPKASKADKSAKDGSK